MLTELAATGGLPVAVRHGRVVGMTIWRICPRASLTSPPRASVDECRTVLPGTSFFPQHTIRPGAQNARRRAWRSRRERLQSRLNTIRRHEVCRVGWLLHQDAPSATEKHINAATLNSAYAMGLSGEYGSITVGKAANFFITEPIPSVDYIPYAYTSPYNKQGVLKRKRSVQMKS